MKYTLSIDDYINLQRYLEKHLKKTAHNIMLRRFCLMLVYICLCVCIIGVTGLGAVAIITIVLIVPVWFLTKPLIQKQNDHIIKRTAKNNNAYLSERETQIVDGYLIMSSTDGVEVKIPLSVIEEVELVSNLICIKAQSAYRIIPVSAFGSETEKGIFLDQIRQK